MHGSQERSSTVAMFRGQTQIPRTLTSEGPAQSQDCVGFVFCQYVLLQGRGRHNQKSTWDLGFSWFFCYCIVLYCIVLYCTVLSCIVLCKAGWLSGWLAGWLYCSVLCCTVLHCTVLYCIVMSLCKAGLYCTVLYCTVLYCTNCIVLYCTVLHCTALHCTVF